MIFFVVDVGTGKFVGVEFWKVSIQGSFWKEVYKVAVGLAFGGI